MTTDKVRVEIQEYETISNYEPKKRTLEAQIFYNNGLLDIDNLVLSKDRDNWIDITLPEEIDGETKFKVCISYTDKWKAKMWMKPEGWNSKNIVGRNRIYELQVTVF